MRKREDRALLVRETGPRRLLPQLGNLGDGGLQRKKKVRIKADKDKVSMQVIQEKVLLWFERERPRLIGEPVGLDDIIKRAG